MGWKEKGGGEAVMLEVFFWRTEKGREGKIGGGKMGIGLPYVDYEFWRTRRGEALYI